MIIMMNVIDLCSDDDDKSPPAKKSKPVNQLAPVIVELSDEENDIAARRKRKLNIKPIVCSSRTGKKLKHKVASESSTRAKFITGLTDDIKAFCDTVLSDSSGSSGDTIDLNADKTNHEQTSATTEPTETIVDDGAKETADAPADNKNDSDEADEAKKEAADDTDGTVKEAVNDSAETVKEAVNDLDEIVKEAVNDSDEAEKEAANDSDSDAGDSTHHDSLVKILRVENVEPEVIGEPKLSPEGDRQATPCNLSLKVEESGSSKSNNSAIENGMPSTSTNTSEWSNIELPNELEAFLVLCQQLLQSSQTDKKLRTMRNTARRAITYTRSAELKKHLAEFTTQILYDSKLCAKKFVELWNLLKSHQEVEFDVGDIREQQLDALYKKFNLVKAEIARLDELEVDLDDENSSFVKLDRYQQRANEILQRISRLEKRSLHAGIAYFSRLDFGKSKYQEFNNALNKAYGDRRKHTFPTFYDVNKLLRRCVKKRNMEIADGVLKVEIKRCFEELGKLLKQRRQKDLEHVHSMFLPSLRDPARDDPALDKKLRHNHKSGKRKLEAVLVKFAEMQDTGIDPDLSADSDDSNYQDSEDDREISD